MDLTLPGLSDVWKESEEFRPLKFPRPCFFWGGGFPTVGNNRGIRSQHALAWNYNKHKYRQNNTKSYNVGLEQTHTFKSNCRSEHEGKSDAFSDTVRCF